MPLFDTSGITYEEPISNRLGDYGVSYTVGKIVWIAAADNAVNEVFSIKDPTDIDLAKVGSGDFGKAIFRRGRVYTITDAEEFILAQAGYTTIAGTVFTPGDDIQAIIDAERDDTYWFRGGTYLQQEIRPYGDETFTVAPGETAILDGELTTQYAFKAPAWNPTGITIDGLEIKRYASGDKKGAIATGTGGPWVIQNCNIHHNLNPGIATYGDSYQFLNNTINYNGQLGLKMQSGIGCTVQGNEIAYNNPDLLWGTGDEAGGTKFLKMTNLLLKDNWVHHNLDNGLWCDHENLGTIYEDNTVEYNGGNGIFHEISYGAIIRNNIVRYNLKRGIYVASSMDVEVHGNTVIALLNTDGISGSDSDRGDSLNDGTWRVEGLNVHDNTVRLVTGWCGLRDNKGFGVVWSVPAANVWADNTYYAYVSDPFFWDDNDNHTFSAWQAFGLDTGGSFTLLT